MSISPQSFSGLIFADTQGSCDRRLMVDWLPAPFIALLKAISCETQDVKPPVFDELANCWMSRDDEIYAIAGRVNDH